LTGADEKAERIIKSEGLTFALAFRVGTDDDMREARAMLKAAIVKALIGAARAGQAMDP
jgi:hypothetical protein